MKKVNYDLVNRTRHEVKKREQKNGGQKLTRKQVKRIMILASVGLFALGDIVGGTTTLALNKATENHKVVREIDASENKSVRINTFKKDLAVDSKVEVYVDGSKIDENEKNLNEQIDKTVKEQVDNLKNSEEVLNYIKEIYVNEYNNTHDQKITTDGIEIFKRKK